MLNSAYNIMPISGSKLGLSLSYAFALVGYVNGLVDSVSRTEQEFISVERVGEYLHLPDEYKKASDVASDCNKTGVLEVVSRVRKLFVTSDDEVSASSWPLSGKIELNNVSFSYVIEQEEYNQWRCTHTRDGSAGKTHHLNYENGSPPEAALRNVSACFETGSRTVVIGRTGNYDQLKIMIYLSCVL